MTDPFDYPVMSPHDCISRAQAAEAERDRAVQLAAEWERRYRQEHKTRHAMEDTIARLRASLGEDT